MKRRSPIDKLIEAAEQFIEVADLGPSTEAYEKALRKLQVEIKAASQVPEDWQPIETAPRDGRPFLAVVDGAVRKVYWGKTSHIAWVGFNVCDQGPEDCELCEPTLWMPMPKPPASGPKEGK